MTSAEHLHSERQHFVCHPTTSPEHSLVLPTACNVSRARCIFHDAIPEDSTDTTWPESKHLTFSNKQSNARRSKDINDDVLSEHWLLVQEFTEYVYRAVIFLLHQLHLMTICMYIYIHIQTYVYVYICMYIQILPTPGVCCLPRW